MSLFKKNPILVLGLLALVLIGLPAAVFLSQKQADDRSRASKTVLLSYSPSSEQQSPIVVAPNSSTTLDLMLDPGTSQVSFLKAELTYDATKFAVDNGGFVVNQQTFPQTIQGPIYSPGKVSFAISVGADGTKAIQSPAKAGTLTLRALSASGTSEVGFAANAQALSIDPNSTPTENVISGTKPAYLSVSGSTTITPTSPPTSCSNNPSDTMLVIDKSGSMSVAADVNKITQAKTAAKSYVDIIAQDTRNKIGLVSYENTATIDAYLTDNYSSVKNKIDTLTAIGSTCTECGIKSSNQALAQGTQKKVVILLTDGKANFVEGNPNQVDVAIAEQRALAAAAAGKNAGIVYYTIGLGQEINTPFLQQIAASSGGKYFASPTGDQLGEIYRQISLIAAQGSVTGAVFNDANNNKIFDSNEAKLSGWTLELYLQGVKTSHNIVSDATGFNITGLCNGTYNLKEVLKPGWRQTIPTDLNGYTIVIDNGNAITDRNFGNKQGNTCADGIDNNNNNLIDGLDPICHNGGVITNPYNPDLPEGGGIGGTELNLTILLHGIGASGDNVNETLSSLSNKNPLNKTLSADAFIYNINNELISSASGQMNYSSASGSFKGLVRTASPLPAGSYDIRVKTDRHLIRRLPGIQNISVSSVSALPAVHLVTGDIDNNNKLNILDYNILMDCYTSGIAPAPSCNDQTKKTISDINDDGLTNQTDYNLFLREIANQPGQ